MISGVNNAFLFLLNTFFDMYVTILIVRIMLQLGQVNLFNPIAQFIHRLTTPLVTPCQRVLPRVAGIDLAVVALIVAIMMLKFTLLAFFSKGMLPGLHVLLIVSIASSLDQVVMIFFYAILIAVILSWLAPMSGPSPLTDLLYRVTEPLLGPARRYSPDLGGLDVSPIIVMLALQVIRMIFIQPLYQLAF